MANDFTVFASSIAELYDDYDPNDPEDMRERMMLADAVLMYGLHGVEIELPKSVKRAFKGLKNAIDNSKNKREQAKKGGRPRKAKAEPEPEPEPEQKPETEVSESENPNLTCPSLALPSLACDDDARGCADGFTPPTLDECRAYFAANCLRGDARQFFDHYAAQGWTLPSGLPVTDVWALARNWSRKQVGFDADRKARGGQTSQEVERASVWKPAETEDDVIAALERELGEAS